MSFSFLSLSLLDLWKEKKTGKKRRDRKKKTPLLPVLLQAREVGRLVALLVEGVGGDLRHADADVLRVADQEVLGERVGAGPEVGCLEVGRGLFRERFFPVFFLMKKRVSFSPFFLPVDLSLSLSPSLSSFLSQKGRESETETKRNIKREGQRERKKQKKTHGSVGRLLDADARGQPADEVVGDAAGGVGLEGRDEFGRGGDAVVLVEEL